MSKKTVRVRLFQGAAGPTWSAGAGDVVWLEEGEAQGLVEAGYGELVDEQGRVKRQEAGVVEAAVVEEAVLAPEVETAEGRRVAGGAARRPAGPGKRE